MLKNIRKKIGISQEYMAKKLNVSQSYYCKLENGKFNNVNIDIITKISKELNLDPEEVFNYFFNSHINSNLK